MFVAKCQADEARRCLTMRLMLERFAHGHFVAAKALQHLSVSFSKSTPASSMKSAVTLVWALSTS